MQRSVREVAELYGSEKSFVVEVQRDLSGLHYTALIVLERWPCRLGFGQGLPMLENYNGIAKLQRRRQELTQTTSDQSVDDEAVYYKVAGECPK
ncbi:hypothetical protein Syun_030141 [Stephania yunnanensis]|uniref:Uncharacterized protein n=1 Tax=Stephania yunnanensis TaxID=152371 RepID=A0AAP0HK88_9MAGN